MAQSPFEIIAAPFTIYLGAVGTAFPDVSQTPSGSWIILGTNGNLNYSDTGIKVTHEQNVVEFMPVGATAATKAFRTSETLKFSMELVDVSATQYAKVLNNATVSTQASGGGNSGYSSFPLNQGYTILQFACLLRSAGDSAGGNNFNTQYQLPRMYQSANPEPVWKKGDPATLAIEWTALYDATNGFGKYVSQTAAFA
jgi:hypothetical protein